MQSQEGMLYTQGTAALDKRDWDTAAKAFAQAATLKGERADAALYWRAYTLHQSGRRDEALQSIAALRSAYPRSRWIKDATALDLEIRQASGQAAAVDAAGSDDLKLLALGGLMNADPARALPLIKQMLARSPTDAVRDRAMFVLAQSGSPEARQVLLQMAKGDADPEVQATAVRYLGLFGGDDSRQALVDIYATTPNAQARRAVLNALMLSGTREQLTAIARTETAPELRARGHQPAGCVRRARGARAAVSAGEEPRGAACGDQCAVRQRGRRPDDGARDKGDGHGAATRGGAAAGAHGRGDRADAEAAFTRASAIPA